MEAANQRTGDNLYPASLQIQFGDYRLDLDVPEGVWNPTPHGLHLGNMLATMDFGGQHVLELGTGCGIHAILLALRGATKLTLTELDLATLDNARHNLAKHDVGCEVETTVADWTHVDGGPYDAVVTNPPFGKAGKRYRRYFIDTLILDTHKLVKPGGSLVFVHSSMADVPRTMSLLDEHGMTTEIVGVTSGPFRPYYFEDPAFLRDMAAIPGAFDHRDGQYFERLVVFHAKTPAN